MNEPAARGRLTPVSGYPRLRNPSTDRTPREHQCRTQSSLPRPVPPIGTARKGTLLDVSAFDLAKYAVGEALKRSGIPAGDVDDAQMGESLQGGGDIARYAAVDLGLTEVPGVALNRHCASGMAAVQGAAASIIAGMDKVVIAGGAESMSTYADGA